MSDDAEKLRYFLKRVTANLAEARQRLAGIESAAGEPLAIVGMGCRFPGGVRGPEDLWELLAAGGDAISGFPQDRGWDLPEPGDGDTAWPVRGGGFLYDAADFDAGFFGISPREALAMDPQQRLLLEVSWEALERAGIDPGTLRGSSTGMFAGGSTSGYGWLTGGLDAQLMTGSAMSVLSGRVAYALGLEGPAVTVDTACSSALVAMHMACRALRAGDCTLALVGGVFVAVTQLLFTDFSQQLGLSPDGRCKAFGAGADGMGVAEGAGVLVVERLSDARRNGHPVLAVVRGSAMNSDGASNGLTAPNGPSQQRLIWAALQNAGVRADQVDLVEAHGTGTPLGDPIEAQALLATYGQDRPEGRPLWLGSVKSNLGHPQQAAGTAGLIKMVLALQHRLMPRTLHADERSPHVDWVAGDVQLLTEAMPWPGTDGGEPRRGGVSGFGMGGTNVHVILEEAPAEAAAAGEAAGAVPGAGTAPGEVAAGDAAGRLRVLGPGAGVHAWLVSGRSAAALAAQAGRLAVWAGSRPGLDAGDVGWSLATTRSVFEHRAVVTGAGREDLAAGLAAVAAGEPPGAVAGMPGARAASGQVPAAGPGRVAFVFAGQGAQWAGMGTELAAASPVFAARLAECSAALEPYTGWRVQDVLSGAAGAPPLDGAQVVQPALWAVMVALAAVWEAAGVIPDAVTGHSQGEIAAATVAGILPLPDAARVVAARSRALAALGAGGGMLSVVMPDGQVRELLARWAGRLQVAAVNSPAATVVSGDAAALAELGAELAARRVLRWPVPDTGFVAHSPRLDDLAAVLEQDLAGIRPGPGRVPMYSTVTGGPIDGPQLDAGYWFANLRREVAFAPAVRTLAENGHRIFIEVSPHPVLTTAVAETLAETPPGTETEAAANGPGPLITGTLRRDDAGPAGLLASLAAAHIAGAPVDWASVLPTGQRVELPTYAFSRQRYWLRSLPPQAPPARDGAAAGRAEERFWAAVEEGSAREVAEVLSLPEPQLAELLPALASWHRRERSQTAIADWRYLVRWIPVPDSGPGLLPGTWLVVPPAAGPAGGCPEPGSLTEQCVRTLAARGAQVVVLPEGPQGLVGREELAARIAGAAGAGTRLSGVLSLLALDEAPLPRLPDVPAGLAGTLTLLQALGDAGTDAPLWVLTSGAVAAAPGEVLTSPVQAQAWGLGRAASLELPDRWGGLIDVPPVLDERAGERLCAVLAGCGEDQAAIRPAGIMGLRLARAGQPGAVRTWVPSGTALVTGGTGAIGGHVARWLAGRGAPRLVLASRSGPAAGGAAALAAELAAAGTTVEVTACDTAERAGLAGLLDRIAATGPGLTSVFHTAVVIDDGVLDRLDAGRMAPVLAVKAGGAALLDELTAGTELDAFVLFSSVAGILGGAGQGSYAAANSYLDALAESRRSRGLPALSVAFGPWAGTGIAAADAASARLRRNQWEVLMDPLLAIGALDQAMTGPETVIAVMNVDWPQIALVPGAAGLVELPFLRDLPEARQLAASLSTATAAGARGADGGLAAELAGLNRAEQDRVLTDLIRSEAAAVLGHSSPGDVDAGRAFSEMGFDSLTAVELRNRLAAETALRLPATLLFDYPAPVTLAGYLRAGLLGDQDRDTERAVAPPVPSAGMTAEPVAIVGMGCRYPGGVRSPEDLWELVAAGTDAITGFPRDRGWDEGMLDHAAGKVDAQAGGFVHEAGQFDAGFFGISPREALAMDPQQRLLLEISWEALERAGIDPATLRGSRTGVFAGGYASGYGMGLYLGDGDPAGLEGYLMTGGATAVISGRVAYALGLEGPAVTVDTACSSALVALHMAGQALRSGECTLALAGGVTIMATPWEMVGMSRQGGLASDGRCKAFGAAADGMGMAEGAGVLVLERLSDALRNGHRVLALVKGTAVNSDGASNGLTAPNGPSQQRVIRTALAQAGVTAGEVDAVEAHGTGTSLGDPIEAQALLATYGQDRPGDRPLLLGSVKSNIGHTQAAAGAAGVMKMVLALQHQELPRTLHVGEPSPYVDWQSGDVRLLTAPAPWKRNGRPRRAGVSSFGISGTNAHVIIEEAPDAPAPAAYDPSVDGSGADESSSAPVPQAGEPVLAGAGLAWLVSARSAAGLAGQASRLAAWVTSRPELDPADVAWSLATTRTAFDHRAVLLGTRADELTARLTILAAQPGAEAARPPEVITGPGRPGGAGRVGFLFAGQGAQRAGMGAGLHAASPVFAQAFDAACQRLEAQLGVPLAEVILGDGADARASQTLYAQPGLFAVQVGLVALLAAAGITPGAVAGHSVGEVAAAWAAGVLSMDDACTLVATRARLMQELPGGGAMCAIAAAEDEVALVLADNDLVTGGAAVIAAVNGLTSVVVSGAEAAVAAVAARFADRGVRTRRLRVSHAFHSPLMDPVLGRLDEAARRLAYAAPAIPWAGALDGELITSPDPAYWAAQARRPVRFAGALSALAARGISAFMEIGPDATLSAIGEAEGDKVAGSGEEDGREAVFIPLLRPRTPAADSVLSALARAHVAGADVDWAAVLPAARRIDLPTYAFQHQQYWARAPHALARREHAEPGGAGAAGDARFWAAVEDGKAGELAGLLGIDGGQAFDRVLPALASWRQRERAESALGSWRYRVTWVPVPDPGAAALPGTWLLAVPAGQARTAGQVPAGREAVSASVPGIADACAAAMTARGARVVTVEIDCARPDRAPLTAQIAGAVGAGSGQAPAPGRSGDLSTVAVTGVLSLLALDEVPLPGLPAVPAGLAATLALVQALGDAGIAAPLRVVTRGAVAPGPGELLTSPVQAQVWGLGRVVALEHPDRWGGLIDLPPEIDERAGARLCAALTGCGEDQAAIRPAGIFGRRLTHAPGASGDSGWTAGGTALVTGGTGAIGGHVARWLASNGASRLALTSRSGPGASRAAELAAELAAAGTSVTLTACDVADEASLACLLAGLAVDGPALTSVFHTAAALDDGVVDRLDPARLSAALDAKAAGAVHLDKLTADLPLDAFVLFSSVAGSLGGAGQGNYAAANAFLDALAENRRGRGLAALSVAWGPWAGGGMAADSEAARIRLGRGPMPSMDPALALRALGQALDGPDRVLAVMDVDWTQLASMQGAGDLRQMPLVRDLPEIQQLPLALEAQPAGDVARRLSGLPAAGQERLLTDLVRAEAAAVLGYGSASEVEPRRAFSDLGFDSLTAVELRNRLTALTGLALPATVAFDYPTAAVLARFLRAELTGGEAVPDVPAAGRAADSGEPIAIVGIGCRFPGGAASPQDLWELLAARADTITAFPTDRGWDDVVLDAETGLGDASYPRAGGFVADATGFDAGFFAVSPREAIAMDPQQRLMLEVAWEALERARIEPGSLRGSRTGVFVGGYGLGYEMGLVLGGGGDGPGPEGYLMTGNATSVISGRVSYALGLEGPAVTVDTACSSSLVALHLACQAIRSGECGMALAGGVTVMANPGPFIEFSHQQGLAADGRCKPFSAEANGIVWGEGAGALVLERLSDARRNGHQVLAVITGSATNSDGASNGLTAPNGPSQQRVIRAALASAGLSPGQVDAVEAHGTGTVLGDPIEAQALIAAYGQDRPADRPLWLGSVKSNIGHTGAAAGVAGVIKMVLALKHQQLPPTLHADQPSPHVDWSAGDVRLLTEPVPWPAGGNRRRAGISAFGISGTNAHLIVEEAPAIAAESPDVTSGPTEAAADPVGGATTVPVLASGTDAHAWPVSGRSAVALAAQAGKLASWMSGHPGLDPASVGWSLATTRSAFEHRAVIIAAGPAGPAAGELAAGLSALGAGQTSAGIVSGAVPPGGDPGKVVFVFPGQGGQWAGMGTELAESSPVFAAKLAECATALVPYTGWDLHEVLSGAGGAPDLDRVDVVQPALWAVMVSLAAVWQAAGVVPDAVAGHSQGEIAAAAVAEILSLEDAARVVALRSRALTALSGRGAMASVAEPAGAVRERLAAWPSLSVAAVNGPLATVVSGDPEEVRDLVSACEADGTRARILPVDYASHGPQVADLEREITAALAGITPGKARIPMVSAMTGDLLAGPEADAGYWYASLRNPVEFARSVEVLAADGHRVFVEVSPRPVLTVPVTEALEGLHAGGTVTGTLRPGDGGPARLLKSLAAAWAGGAAVNWAAVLPPAPTVDLPTYAFQRQHYWGSSLRALQSLRAAGPAGTGSVGTGPAAAGSVRDGGAGTVAETRFWAAVEGGNLQELADTLAVDGQRPFSEVLPALASWRRREQFQSAVADWRYRVSWAPVSVPGTARLAGRWLLVVPGGGVVQDGEGRPGVTGALAARVAEALASHGATVVVVTGGWGQAPQQPDRAVLARLLTQAVADGETVRDADPATGGGLVAGVVSLLALDEAPLPGFAAVPGGLAGTLSLVQAMGDAGISAPLWALTSGAVTMPGEALASPVQAQTWGLGRVAALEHPDRWGGLVDVPAVLDGRSADLLCAVLAGCGEDQVAVRPTGASGRRLVRAGKPAAGQARAWVPSGTVLVTGGTGAVGGHVARWLASRRAPRVILTSRSGSGSAGAAALAAALAGAGTAVTIAACDSGSREQLAGLLAGAGGSGVRAVFHAAGVTQATGLADMSAGDLSAVLAAKAGGAAYLDELTAEAELDAFVLFSSGAGAWGSGLQGGYAAANAFADALATARRSRGLPAVSVAWGAWGGGGMTSLEAATALARRGVRMMDPARAVAALAQVVDAAEDQLIVTDTDWSRFAPTFTARRPSPLISGVAEARHALEDGPAEAGARDAGLRGRLAGLAGDEQERVLTDLVRAEAASVLGHPGPGAIDPDRAFKDLGFDSLTALDLRNRLSAATGLALPSTIVYDHPSPAILARHLQAEEFGAEEAPDPLAAELDKLESLLSQATSDDEARETVGNRLKRMLAKLNGAAAQEESQVVAQKIAAASDDEVINFIHAELGR